MLFQRKEFRSMDQSPNLNHSWNKNFLKNHIFEYMYIRLYSHKLFNLMGFKLCQTYNLNTSCLKLCRTEFWNIKLLKCKLFNQLDLIFFLMDSLYKYCLTRNTTILKYILLSQHNFHYLKDFKPIQYYKVGRDLLWYSKNYFYYHYNLF